MDHNALALAEQWERELADPASPQSAINFHAALELDEHERFPQAAIDALRDAGAFEMLIPASEGGRLREPEQLVMLGRLISRRDVTAAIAFGQTMLGSIPLWLAGSAAQKSHLADDLRAARLGCLALTEKGHGSDILSNELTGEPDGDGWRMSGAKWLINNGSLGGSATVLGRVQRPGRTPEMALWWLRRPPTPGEAWRSHPKIRTLGIRGADISGFALDRHAAGAEAFVRSDEPAIYTVLKTLQISRILCSGFSLGAVDTMFRLAFGFARERQLYGKRVLDIPAVRARLAHCMSRILVADLVAQVASRSIVAMPQELSLLSAIAKFHVPTESESVGRELGVVLGARHYVRSDMPHGMFQKMLRDCQVVSLFDGSTQVNLSLIAGQLRALGERLSAAAHAAPDASALQPLERLFVPDRSCAGWPHASELKLGNQGQDSVAAAFLRLGPVAGACGPAVSALRARWQAWLKDCEQVTQVQRLPHDSVKAMQLAERYVALHSAAVAVLGWRLAGRRGASQAAITDDVLVTYLAGRWPEAGIDVDESQHQRIVDMAQALVDGQRLLSLQDVALAGTQNVKSMQ